MYNEGNLFAIFFIAYKLQFTSYSGIDEIFVNNFLRNRFYK